MNKTIYTKVSAVTCIQASRCIRTKKLIFSLECEYPRGVHAQLLTHGALSKNSSSTRAVPLKAAIAQVRENISKVIWTTNQSGMQGSVVTDHNILSKANSLHNVGMENMISLAQQLNNSQEDNGLNIHKQNAGRYLEPFQNIKIVLTSTEWENWDWLRIHEDAQGEIADLAIAIKEARETAEIMDLYPGEWHVPYVERSRTDDNMGVLEYFVPDGEGSGNYVSTEQAKSISSSVCAQLSYRKADYSLEKATKMKNMLLDGHKVHASPFEHQATPILDFDHANRINDVYDFDTWEKGVTHLRKDGILCSGNFVGWVQNRQLISRHDKALF
jgi:hypothetical protein